MEKQDEFGQRYRRWIDAYTLDQDRSAAIWQEIQRKLARNQILHSAKDEGTPSDPFYRYGQ